MDKKIIIPESIEQIIEDAAKEIGAYEREMFCIAHGVHLKVARIESPIEQALYIGLRAVQVLNSMAENISVYPQFAVGNFRVDFAVRYHRKAYPGGSDAVERIVLVECDSQQFHDRTEAERSYEKQRDRFLQTQGYKVFRFTGAEILREPFAAAAEIICFVSNSKAEEIIKRWSDISSAHF